MEEIQVKETIHPPKHALHAKIIDPKNKHEDF
jgi:hypothetical protein